MNKEKSITNTSTVPKGRRRINTQQTQNVLLIWLDSNIDETNDGCQNTITKLRCIVNDINTFTDSDQCLEFIQTVVDNKVCMIVSESLGQQIVPRVHNMFQVDSIFICCGNQKHDEQWVKEWPKIKGVFTDITPICEALKEAAHQCEQNAIPMSFVGANKKLDQLDPSFMYTQIIKEIFLTIKFEQKHIQEYFDYCRNAFVGNKKELKNIQQLEDEYHNKTPIYWYTCQTFLYPMLNRALRLMDGDIITHMGFFISDLHRHIEQLHQEQYVGSTAADTFTVYRGQGLSAKDFEQMIKIKGGLISFNNFLSTSKERDLCYSFAESNQANPDLVGILFIMKVDPSQSTSPFALIAGISSFKEGEEVLFSMHSVFRVQDIKQMGGNNRLCEVNLTLTADNDPELNRLTDYIRKESYSDTEGWNRLGMVLRKMGQFDKAEDIYQVLLDQTNDDKNRVPIYHQLGLIKDDQGKYQEALVLYEKSLTINQKTLPPNHPDLIASYNNIGSVHYNMNNYSKALSSYEKVLEIQQRSLPPNHSDLASSYNNIGVVHRNMGNYSKALSSNEKALEIWQQSLSPNHPDLASSYNNIGLVYKNMANYQKALSSYEKALEIQRQSLLANHPDLASSYNNLGSVHRNVGNYSEALSYYEKAFEIQQQSLPSDHSDLAKSYGNIGNVHCNMGNYPKALSCHEKAFKIQQQSLLANHPDLAKSYVAIGNVYYNMGDYPKALLSYEKALEIQQQSLPRNHPDLASSYNNIGVVHRNMDDYPKALLSYEKALEIRQQSLPDNHPDLASSNNKIGAMHDNMGNYPKALSSYEKVLEIRQQSLPSNHPALPSSYGNIGNVYAKMGNFPKALSYYEKAFEIQQQSLPANHPDLAKSYNNIGVVHYSMDNYFKALLSHEKALEIRKQSLHPNHPNLASSYNNIGLVYENMSNFAEARTFYEHAVQIAQQSLSSNHRDIQLYRNNLKDVQNK
ncbi:unnamed protein product [Adineta steineri]|uniref:ADP ribosyltransferase domain-containing protein n=1 Tax=Adineta steineri TaxID=433720 RepID=A0A814QZ18_9BILA|nr:unnamed protein product [Adineta steineri]CAF1125710.1 unnamed protein product [Adineta steineri]